MRKQFAFPLALVLGMIAGFACSFGDLVGSNAPSPAPTVALLPTIAPLATVPLQPTLATQTQPTVAGTGKIIGQDDFSDTKSGWQTKKEDCCEWLYLNSAYHIRVFKNNFTVFSLLPKNQYDEVSVEVDATRDSGLPDNLFGIACRMSSDYSQGYIFLIRSDGGHVIVKVTGDNRKELALGKQSSAILPTSGVNRLRADCMRDRMTFYVNGQKLIEAQDSEYKKGQVGLVVLSQSNGSVDIRFDNFMVRAP